MALPEQKTKKNKQQNTYRAKVASPGQKAKRNTQQKAYRLKNITNIDSAISKFHETLPKVHCMFARVVISYGIDIVCFLLKNLENLILKASNVYVIKPVSIM